MRHQAPRASWWAAAAFGCAAGAAAAQVPAAALEPVIVTGSAAERRAFDAPYAIGVVDAATLRSAGPGVNLSEALVRVPGLAIGNRSNYAQDLQISSRGYGARATFGVRGLRLYTDGIPATMPDGSGAVTHFDLAGAQRIEVLRGPFSALYGNSSGGVVALFSAPPGERSVELGADAARFGMRQLRVAVGAPLAAGWDLRAGASAFEIEGFRPHSEARRRLATARLGYQGESDSVTLLANAITQPADDPLGLTRAQFEADPLQTAAPAIDFDTRKTARQDQLGVNWRRRIAAGALSESALTAYVGRREVAQWQSITLAPQQLPRHPGGVIDLEREYRGLDARLVWQAGTALRGVTGFNLEEQDERRRGYENFVGSTLGVTGALRRDEDNTARSREAYAQAEWTIRPTLSASVGARTGSLRYRTRDAYIAPGNGDDSGELSLRYTNPVAGLSYTPVEPLNLYLSFGRGFEAPTLNELAYRRNDEGTGFNTALRPMKSRQVEIGAKWRPPGSGLRLELALFRADTRDEIGVVSNSGGRSTFQNVGRTRRDGAELAALWQVTPQWRATLAASWLDASYRDGFLTCTATPCREADVPVAAGNRIPGTTSKSGYAELAWMPSPNTEIGLELRGQAATPVNDLNSERAAGWGLVNLRALQRYALPADGWTLELLARLDNAADRRYAGSVIVNEGNQRYYETGVPRSASIGLRLRSRW